MNWRIYLGWRPLLMLWAALMVVLVIAISDSAEQESRMEQKLEQLHNQNERNR